MPAPTSSTPARRKTNRSQPSPRRPASPPDLSEEIAILRKAIRKVSVLSEAETPNLSTRLEALAAIGMAINRLAGALKTQRDLQGSSADADSAIMQALAEVSKELGFS